MQPAALVLDGGARRLAGQLLLFISSLQGGETCAEMRKLMALAATAHRAVHVIVPGLRQIERAQPRFPGSLGHQPSHREVLPDIEQLGQALRLFAFRRDLLAAGVAIHSIEDRNELDGLVADLLRSELHW